MPYIDGVRVSLETWIEKNKAARAEEPAEVEEEAPPATSMNIRRQRRPRAKAVAKAVEAATGVAPSEEDLSTEDKE